MNLAVILVTIFSCLILAALATIEIALRNGEDAQNIASESSSKEETKSTEKQDLLFAANLESFRRQIAGMRATDWRFINFSSEYLNICGGWRETTNQPQVAQRNLFLFGGSTVQCLEVTDSDTVASHLQRVLNARNLSLRVHNRGYSGMKLARNLEVLRETELAEGDSVIVLFGDNDAKGTIYRQTVEMPFKLIPGYRKIVGFLRIRLKLRLAHWLWLETVRAHSRTLKEMNQNTLHLAETLDQMSNLVNQHGGIFLACLQPNVFTKLQLTQQERKFAHTNLSQVIRLQYSSYETTLKTRPYYRSLVGAMNENADTVFLDWAHVGTLGNQLLAVALCDALEREIRD